MAGLRALGIVEGSLLQVHSSLSRMGHVDGGAATVVGALLEAVGPTGTLMAPTFNHGTDAICDIRETPSANGAVSEAVRRHPAALRSIHPTHPYAAIGPAAEWLTDGHLEVETFDRLSPLGKLADAGGYVLLLGVGMSVNTAAHIGETMARAHCIGYGGLRRKVRLPDGRLIGATSVLWRDGPCLIEWDPLEARMRARDMIRTGMVGEAECRLMKALDVIETAHQMALELCPGCPSMPDPNWNP